MKISILKSISALFMAILSLTTTLSAYGKDEDKAPDFNFPKTVIIEANVSLQSALKAGNYPDVVRYLIQSTLSSAIISQDSIQSIVDRIDSLASAASDEVGRSVLYYLEAKVLDSYVTFNYNKAADRKTTATPSKDITEWSKDNFTDTITSLAKKSLSCSEALLATSADSYYLDNLHDSNIVYPTMFDMLAYNYIDMLNNGSIGFSKSANHARSTIDGIYKSLCMLNSKKTAPFINASIQYKKWSNNGRMTKEFAMQLYKKYASNEASFIALQEYINLTDDEKESYALLVEYLDNHPKSVFAPNARNRLNSLSSKDLNIKYNESFTSVDSILVNIFSTNINNAQISLYRVPDNVYGDYRLKQNLDKLQLVDEKIINIKGVIPFHDTTFVSFAPQRYGRYAIFVNDAGNKNNESATFDSDVFRVSDVTLFSTSSTDNEIKVFAVNSITGHPIEGVYVNTLDEYGLPKRNYIKSNKTGNDGCVTIKITDDKHYNVAPFFGKDYYGEDLYLYSHYDYSAPSARIKLLTDLAVYRPGDTIRYCAICYKLDKNNKSVIKNMPLSITFYDSNYQKIATDTIISDEYGRANATFIVPNDRMNGVFRIKAQNGTGELAAQSYATFNVSEYKTPAFYVEFDGERSSFPRDTSVVLTGKAEYFSGLPVANANIKCTLSYQIWNWLARFNYSLTTINEFETTTGNDGTFTITLPAESLNNDKLPKNVKFNIAATVTDDAGESQSTSKMFWLGTVRSIMSTSSDFTFENSNVINLPVKVRSSEPTDTLMSCIYKIYAGDKEIANGTFLSSDTKINLASIPSGKYELKVSIQNDTTTKEFETPIILFRDTDKVPPVQSPLWIPNCCITTSNDNKVSLTIGNTTDMAHVYCIAATKKGIIKETWLQYGQGMHSFNIDIPKEEDEYVDLTFICVSRNKTYTWARRFESVVGQETLKIIPIAFRNKLIPGLPETWTFRLVNQNDKLRTGALICKMYDKAINNIANENASWTFNTDFYYSELFNYYVSGTTAYYTPVLSSFFSMPMHVEPAFYYTIPDLNLYNRSYAYGRNIHVRGKAMRNMSMADTNIIVEEESSELQEVVVTSSIDELASPKLMADAGSGDSELSVLDNIQLRTSNISTALWEPELVTDENGEVSIKFNAPLFNTTWMFKAIAYTHDLHTASIVNEIVTAKPIMVKARLPRFVRSGDEATLSASLMNATDSAQHCSAIVELFIPQTNEVIMSQKFEVSLDKHKTRTLEIKWSVPDELPFIGYRVKAATEQFGDGEQQLLPILQSVSPVTETHPFYLQTNETIELTIDDVQKDNKITLEFCNNPVWYCLTALPSIKTDDDLTASALAHSLYAISVAQGIVSQNDSIKAAIEYWAQNPEDSTLISQLQQNSNLKIGTLLASPWIDEADRQTLRMQQIVNLVDSATVQTEINNIVKKLQLLQMHDGGWTWFKYSGCKSSMQVTNEILQLFGELKRLGYLPKDASINAMIGKALTYYDTEIVKEYNRLTDKKNLNRFYPFAYVHSLFPDNKPQNNAGEILTKTINDMADGWKNNIGIAEKAYCALTLHRYGKDKIARNIMESIRQFSITDTNGTRWDNIDGIAGQFRQLSVTSLLLQAYGEIVPNDREYIDGIRQWVLLQKQSTDWGNSSMAADVVYAILSTGSDWTGNQPVPDIMVNGKQLQYNPSDKYFGYFRKQLDASSSLHLLINRIGASSPAWGAIYNQFKAEMSSIEAYSIDELSIEKQLCKLDGSKLDDKSPLHVGDKVLVRIVIKNKRDLEYVTVNDERASCCEPVNQLSSYTVTDGIGYYRETKDSVTRLFFNYMPKGTHVITYEVSITAAGSYNLGIATIQSQYAPEITAHSAGDKINIENMEE